MSKLVIVESPAKAKTIKKYLGGGYEVIASMGHVRDLPERRLSVDVKKGFKPKYEVKSWLRNWKSWRERAKRFISPPTPIGRGRRFPGIWLICWGLTWEKRTG